MPDLVPVSLPIKAANVAAITGAESLLPGSPIKRQINYSTFSTWHKHHVRVWAGAGLRQRPLAHSDCNSNNGGN